MARIVGIISFQNPPRVFSLVTTALTFLLHLPCLMHRPGCCRGYWRAEVQWHWHVSAAPSAAPVCGRAVPGSPWGRPGWLSQWTLPGRYASGRLHRLHRLRGGEKIRVNKVNLNKGLLHCKLTKEGSGSFGNTCWSISKPHHYWLEEGNNFSCNVQIY